MDLLTVFLTVLNGMMWEKKLSNLKNMKGFHSLKITPAWRLRLAMVRNSLNIKCALKLGSNEKVIYQSIQGLKIAIFILKFSFNSSELPIKMHINN